MYDRYNSYEPAHFDSDTNVTANATVGANFAFGLFDVTGSSIKDIDQFFTVNVVMVVQNFLTPF